MNDTSSDPGFDLSSSTPPDVIPQKKKGWLSWLSNLQNEWTSTVETTTMTNETGGTVTDSAESIDNTPFIALSSVMAETPPPLTAMSSSPTLEEVEAYAIGEIPAFTRPEPIMRAIAQITQEETIPVLLPMARVVTEVLIGISEEPVPVGEASPPEAVVADSSTAAEEPWNKPTFSRNWFRRLKEGLSRSSSRLTQGIVALFANRCLDDKTLEELEELLIMADLGVTTSARLVASLAKTRFNQRISPEEVRATLAADIREILAPIAQPLVIDRTARPYVILVVGVNGSGKTTTIGKMARQFRDDGLQVSLVAGDTFRAAAVEQLKVWGERSDCQVVAYATRADAAGLVFDALNKARAREDDVLLIDTAGRLQNKAYLMAELGKIVRVLRKLEPAAPHACLLVLDATVGQNAHAQVEVFRKITNISGLVVTKLDGTARGGILVALAEKFGVPVHYVGVGEKIEDLHPFSAHDFARSLLGFDT